MGLLDRRQRQSSTLGPESERAEESIDVPTGDEASFPYYSDAAETDPYKDELGRGAFVERVASILANRADPASLVVGLYGPWGDGKSTVLNFIQSRLDEYPPDEVAVVTFNPWFYETEQQIADAFFNALAESIGVSLQDTAEMIGQRLKKLGQVGEALSVAGHGVSVGGKGIAGLVNILTAIPLKERRDRLETALTDEAFSRNPIRIVVLMDDIDRLEKDQILTVFRIVKLAANLPHVSYLLAFDEGVVAASLATQYPDESGRAGYAFLEKIVQVPLHLPTVDQAQLTRVLYGKLLGILRAHQVSLSAANQYRLSAALDSSVWRQIHTLRMGKRFLNAVNFAVPVMLRDVNIVDQILVEAMRTLYPAAYDYVRRNRPRLIVRPFHEEDSEALKREITHALKSLLPNELSNCESLLKELFPYVQTAYEGRAFANDAELEWARQQRICSKDYFSRYFSYGLPIGDIRDSDIDEIVTSASLGTDAGSLVLDTLLDGSHERGLVVEKLIQRSSDLTANASRALAHAIARVGSTLPGSDDPSQPDSVAARAAVLITMLLRNVPMPARVSLAEGLLLHNEQLSFAALVFRWIDSASRGDTSDAPLLEGADIKRIGGSLARELLDREPPQTFFRAYPKNSFLMYGICRQYGNFDRYINRISQTLMSDGDILLFLLGNYLPSFLSTPVTDMITRDGYLQLVWLVPAECILKAIRHHFPEADDLVAQAKLAMPGSPEFRAMSNGPVVSVIQFIRVYETIDQSAPPLPPTAYEPDRDRLSPLSGYDAKILAGKNPHTRTLVLRVGVWISDSSGLSVRTRNDRANSGRASQYQGRVREELLLSLLNGSTFTERLRFGSPDLVWQVSGHNQGEHSHFSVEGIDEKVGNGAFVSMECSVMTGWGSEVARAADATSAGIMVLLDVVLNIGNDDDRFSVREFVDIVVSALDIERFARKAAIALLPEGRYDDGELVVGVSTPEHDFADVLIMDGMEIIPGNSPRHELKVFAQVPLQSLPEASPALGGSTGESAMRLMAIYVFRRLAEVTHRRGYERILNQLMRNDA